MSDTKLDDYDKDEWRDVCRSLNPAITDAEFEALWAEFKVEKARHQAN